MKKLSLAFAITALLLAGSVGCDEGALSDRGQLESVLSEEGGASSEPAGSQPARATPAAATSDPAARETAASPAAPGRPASALAGKLEIDGSSTVYPISEAAAVKFREKFPQVSVTVAISGTGGGFKRFTKGETDISDASRPIKASEFELCRRNKVEFIEIPVAYDGLSIVVHPQNTFAQQLTIEQLKKIFLAETSAKTWKDVDPLWPAEEIKIYAPGKDSGTFDYFFGDVVAKEGGTPRSEGVSFSEDDNALVNGVANERYAIGFFGAAYYFENKDQLAAVKIVNPKTQRAVAPTPETIENGQYAPFSRPLFIYANVQSLRSPAAKKFVEFYLDQAGELAEQVGYVSLPAAVYEQAWTHYENRLTGTHFLTPELEKRSGAIADLYQEDKLVK